MNHPRALMIEPRVVQVIETSLQLTGEGTEASPTRRLTQYYSLEGELLAEVDPCPHLTERRALAELAAAKTDLAAAKTEIARLSQLLEKRER